MNSFNCYGVDDEIGFLQQVAREDEIPCYYTPWIQLKNEIENLIIKDELVAYVEKMPVLSVSNLTTSSQMIYCHCILAVITSKYVWHKTETWLPRILPKSVSIPFQELSTILGIKPILCHVDLVLGNCIVDKHHGLTLNEPVKPNKDWQIFQIETGRIELRFAPIIPAFRNIQNGIKNEDSALIANSLKEIQLALKSMTDAFTGFDEMNPDYFYKEMRPILLGWSKNSFPNQNGLIYENADHTTTVVECIGGSAAQSPTLQMMDALFRIEHSPESQSFLNEMRLYMLNGHRQFLDNVVRKIDLPGYVECHMDNKELVESYNTSLTALSMLRTHHMKLISRFIHNPSKRVKKSDSHLKFLADHGTGGQDLTKFLKHVRDDVGNRKISRDTEFDN